MEGSEKDCNFPIIETARLSLRPLTFADTNAVYQHFSDDEVTRFMGIDSLASLDQAREIIAFHLRDSGCRWGLFNKVRGDLLGTCGYHCWVQGEDSTAEIGYDLGKAYWGQGLMQEGLRAIISLGFEMMGLQRIDASIERENQRSIRLLTKLGFHRELQERDGLLLFSIRRADWAEPMPPLGAHF